MNPMENYTKFKNKTGQTLWFVKVVNKQAMVWKEIREGECICGRLDPTTVSKKSIVDAGIWDKMPAKIQECITKDHEEVADKNRNKMKHARKQRKTRD